MTAHYLFHCSLCHINFHLRLIPTSQSVWGALGHPCSSMFDGTKYYEFVKLQIVSAGEICSSKTRPACTEVLGSIPSNCQLFSHIMSAKVWLTYWYITLLSLKFLKEIWLCIIWMEDLMHPSTRKVFISMLTSITYHSWFPTKVPILRERMHLKVARMFGLLLKFNNNVM